MNGTTAGYLPAVISEGGQTRAIEINRETDPLFSKLTPLPAETGLNRLRKLVRESDSHLGLAFSADGTALGVVDKNGEQLEPIEIVLLLAAYLVRQYRQKGLVIAPAPTADSRFADSLVGLSEWEDALGLKVELAEDASARIAALPATGKNNLLVGCSSEGGIILGNYTLYPDALLAGLMMAELVARNAGNLQAMLNELRGRLETKS
jgi:phosphomannomutase